MTREEIINEIKCLLSELDNGEDAVSYLTQNDVKWLNENIKALEQEPRWIPVSERLPKAYEFVNCTCHSLIDDREDWVIETCYIPQPHNSPYSDWGNILMLNWGKAEVIAWIHRDIPNPYKAESEDKK